VTIDDINKAKRLPRVLVDAQHLPGKQHRPPRPERHHHRLAQGQPARVHFALPSPAEFPKPHTLTLAQDERTTSSYDYIKNPRERAADYIRPAAMVEGIVFLRPRLVGKLAGYNGRFMAAMLPRLKGERPRRSRRLPVAALVAGAADRLGEGPRTH